MADVVAKFSLNNGNINARFDLNEGNAVDAIFKIDASGTTWGSIDGDIANQTDLYNILNTKANQSELDSLSETVSDNYTTLESEINGLSSVVDNNYSETVERFENDELAISNLTNTVSSNYTELNNKVLANSTHITSISDTINSFGDIVTYNASNFATSAQGALANTALQPNDNISELVNNVGYITSANLPTLEDLTTQAQRDAINSGATTAKINQIASNTQAISTETTNRQDADNNLQSQIDAITASSDVTDIVGTYAQLQAYDTSTLPPNSIIKVLQDEHQNYETTYYRWVITGGVGSWVLIGEEGPYYTKSEADGKFVPQTRTVNGKALSTNITLDASDVGALPSSTVIPVVDQTFDGASTNAQSGVAIVGAKFLQNTATGNSSITVNGTATAKSQAINIGTGSQATGNYGTALGAYSFGNASHAVGIGNYAKATADYAIQLNKGTNNTSNSLCVGFNNDNYQLLDGTTGLIPDARISTNIARTSDLSDYVLSDNTGETTYITADTLEISVDTVATINGSNILIAGQNTINNSSFYLDDFEMDYQINGVNVNYFSETFSLISAIDSNTDIGSTLELYTNSFVLSQSPDGNSTYSAHITVPANNKLAINGVDIATVNDLPIIDQTYDSTSANAQSGVAIAGAGFLQNISSNANSISVLGTATGNSYSINIGKNSSVSSNNCIAIGYGAQSQGNYALGFGYYARAKAQNAIQLGYGTNNTADSLQIGSYPLLDTSTGLIPDARISSNIARSSDIPTNTSDLTNDSGFITSSDLPTNHVTTDTDQDITGTKTFVGQKKIAFKQSRTSDKLGFTLYNNSGTEKGYLEYNPSNNVDGVPLMTLGNYATASGGLTHVGFRKYSSISGASGAYNLLTPLISDAKTPFSLTTTYTDFYLPLGFTDGTTTVKTAKSGMVDLSSIIPTATSDLTNDSGFITSIPTATSSTLGMVQPDNTTITIDSNGVISSSGASRNVGEVITSTLPLTDAGLHLLDGTLLQYGIYKEFIDYIADLYAENPTANYFTDETTWQASVTQYGSCGKFVYDSTNNTVRLPKVSDILQSTTDINALGDLIEAGLPNITGTLNKTAFDIPLSNTTAFTRSGAISSLIINSTTKAFAGASPQEGNRLTGFNFDASVSSAIYGNSNTVQPQTIKAFVYIVIANSTKTSIQVDIDEIATDLNNKAGTDLANVTDTGKILMSGMGMPSDSYIDLTLGASGSTYTAPANGYFCLNKTKISQNQYIAINRKSKDSDAFEMGVWSNGNPAATSGMVYTYLPAKKDDLIQIDYSAGGAVSYFRFIYAQGSESEVE